MIIDKNAKSPVSHTFRVESDSYEFLEAKSRKKNVSINVALNQIIKENAFKTSFDKIDSVLMPKCSVS